MLDGNEMEEGEKDGEEQSQMSRKEINSLFIFMTIIWRLEWGHMHDYYYSYSSAIAVLIN